MLTKLAQATTAATPATAATAPTTPTTAPSATGNTAPVAPPPQLDVWAAYPEPIKSYTAAQIPILNGLIYRLSNAVNQMTGGKYNFQALKTSGFQYDPSALPDANTKNLMNFFYKVYKLLLNSGNAFPNRPIDPKQLSNMLNILSQSSELNALGTVSPTGPVANQEAGNSSLQTTIRTTLQSLQPTVAPRPI